MINLKISTEYNFGVTYGRIQSIIDNCSEKHLAITDPNTFGHVKFYNACKKAGINPILGLKVFIVGDTDLMERQPIDEVILLAKNNEGLKEIYHLNTLANQNFYYIPRLKWNHLPLIGENIFIIVPETVSPQFMLMHDNAYIALNISNSLKRNQEIIEKYVDYKLVVIGDNYYPTPDDEETYQLFIKNPENKSSPMHIIQEDEARGLIPNLSSWAIQNTHLIAQECKVTLPSGGLPVFKSDKSIMDLCLEGAKKRNLTLTQLYLDRLSREVELIRGKKYEDYFFIISDLVIYAKNHMLVGPSRGSSAGSLVCYLLFITDIDPILHGLIFERFIDLNREDLPDIDIDFQDTKRYMVIDYLREKYGEKNVGTIGTVLTMQSKSAIAKVAEGLGISSFEIEDFKQAIPKPKEGDSRVDFSILDTFKEMEIGQEILKKYPGMIHAGYMEGHASHHGKHAAGIVVSQHPIDDYCSKTRDGVCQIDKKDAEKINMLKIDALGLRTLSILQDCLDAIGKDRDWLLNYPLDDDAIWKVFNEGKFAGIFQFEGQAVQSLVNQMIIDKFNDLVCLVSLARPGPLASGTALQFVRTRSGEIKPTYMDELIKPDTEETLGCIVYQEQVMNIIRNVGLMSWEEVSELRKIMSKTLGEESFTKYWEKFLAGANKNGLSAKKAKQIWDSIRTFGAYAFNKSHAVSYGLISYWCAILKTYHPIEFYCACLNNSSGDDQSIKLLREFVKGGGEFLPIDLEISELNWTICYERKILIGGFTNLIGVGEKKAVNLITKLENGDKLTPKQKEMMFKPKTPFDNLFETQDKYGDIYKNPKKYKVNSGKVSHIQEILKKGQGDYVFIGKLKERKIKDSNEASNVQRRGGRILEGQTQYLSCKIEDDTGEIMAGIGRSNFIESGKSFLEKIKEDDWLIVKGTIQNDFNYMNILKWRKLSE